MFSDWLMPFQLYQRSKLAQTASALNSVPSWNFTPSCRSKLKVLPSGEVSQDFASNGASSVVPGLVETRPSYIWREMRNVSPSLAMAGSSITGSEEEAKTNVPPPSLESDSEPLSRSLCAHALRANATATEATSALRIEVLLKTTPS